MSSANDPDTFIGASVELQRIQESIREIAYAMSAAGRNEDFVLFGSLAASLGNHVPWVEQALTLAHRVHPNAAGPHLYKAFKKIDLMTELIVKGVSHSFVLPCTTAQVLLAVHATKHTSGKPGLYTLDTPGYLSTYLFVQHRLHPNDNYQTGASIPVDANGAHVWLDATATPIFINAERRDGFDALFANLTQHPGAAMTDVQWMPKEARHDSLHQTLDNRVTRIDHGFNATTRALCDQLAMATPRALGPNEALDVVERWLASPVSTTALWDASVSKMEPVLINVLAKNKSYESLRLWATYATASWSQKNPSEHGMLDTLLPKMHSHATIEQWRKQMNAMRSEKITVVHDVYAVGDHLSDQTFNPMDNSP